MMKVTMGDLDNKDYRPRPWDRHTPIKTNSSLKPALSTLLHCQDLRQVLDSDIATDNRWRERYKRNMSSGECGLCHT